MTRGDLVSLEEWCAKGARCCCLRDSLPLLPHAASPQEGCLLSAVSTAPLVGPPSPPRRSAAADLDAAAAWPDPLTPQQRLARSARFWSVVAPVVLAYQWLQLTISFVPEAEREAEWTRLHEWGAPHARRSLRARAQPCVASRRAACCCAR